MKLSYAAGTVANAMLKPLGRIRRRPEVNIEDDAAEMGFRSEDRVPRRCAHSFPDASRDTDRFEETTDGSELANMGPPRSEEQFRRRGKLEKCAIIRIRKGFAAGVSRGG